MERQEQEEERCGGGVEGEEGQPRLAGDAAVSAAVGDAVGMLSALGLSPDAAAEDGPARHELGDEEFSEVARLKALCDEHAVPYTSIFELCKFVFGVWSNDPTTRVRDAFRNLGQRRAFEREQNEMFAHDLEACLRAVEQHAPRFFQPTGKPLGQRWHIATCPGSLQWEKLDENPETMLKVSRFYIEMTHLSAVDLEELRHGTGILTDYTGVSMWDTFAVIRVMRRLAELTAGPIHAVRLKSVCVLIPDGLVPVAHLGIAIAPHKIQERIVLEGSVGKFGMDSSQLPPHFGGSYQLSLREWLAMRRQHAARLHPQIEASFRRRLQARDAEVAAAGAGAAAAAAAAAASAATAAAAAEPPSSS